MLMILSLLYNCTNQTNILEFYMWQGIGTRCRQLCAYYWIGCEVVYVSIGLRFQKIASLLLNSRSRGQFCKTFCCSPLVMLLFSIGFGWVSLSVEAPFCNLCDIEAVVFDGSKLYGFLYSDNVLVSYWGTMISVNNLIDI